MYASDSLSRYPVAVLLVDDQQMIAEALRRMLISEPNISFHYCRDPSKAIGMAIEVSPTVILQDMVMPEIDGLMLVRFFRANPSTRFIPLIMLSTKEEAKLKAEAFSAGANDYLVKIPDKVELIARIRYHSKAFVDFLRAEERTVQLGKANEEIIKLNERLASENMRLSAEVDVARKLQQMILPKRSEIDAITSFDIAAFMEPATEVGGDYYDVILDGGLVRITIGDVTGHGLVSGVLMLMAQTAVQAIAATGETDPIKFLRALNKVIYANVQRMGSDRNLSFLLCAYQDGKLIISGQHEEVILIRAGGKVERIDTMDLGFPLGLQENIDHLITHIEIPLNPGDLVCLYTDGIPEAENPRHKFYGIERLCDRLQQHVDLSAKKICQKIIEDLRAHISTQKIFDDVTLVVMKCR